MTEAKGIPLAVVIDGANRHEMKLVKETLESIQTPRPEETSVSAQSLCLDKGYDDGEMRELVKKFGFTAHIRSRGEEVLTVKKEAGFRPGGGPSNEPITG